jgi:hypothetical protein
MEEKRESTGMAESSPNQPQPAWEADNERYIGGEKQPSGE